MSVKYTVAVNVDTNNNGVFDVGEPGLAGALVSRFADLHRVDEDHVDDHSACHLEHLVSTAPCVQYLRRVCVAAVATTVGTPGLSDTMLGSVVMQPCCTLC
jgi:hypothetical protein